MASDEYMEDFGNLRRINTVQLTHRDSDDRDGGLFDGRRLSRLSIESTDGDDADGELSDFDKKPKIKPGGAVSLPGTPERRRSGRPIWAKDYSSDAEAPGRRRKKWRRTRERWLDRAWEMKKRQAAAGAEGVEMECRVLVRPEGKDCSMQMDMEEVKACRDLGLELPCDWTVEIPYGLSAGETSSGGGNSPVSNLMISSPGDNPKDVKARLKSWAQAVALASASRLVD